MSNNADSNLAELLLDRLDVAPDDDERVDQITEIVRGLAADRRDQAAEIARLSAALSVALAQLEEERARNAATIRIHSVQIKTRKVIDRTIPREKQGWWADVCPGKRLVLRDATASDLARCHRNKGASQDPADYFCELAADGSLVSRFAVESMHTTEVPVPPIATIPGAKP